MGAAAGHQITFSRKKPIQPSRELVDQQGRVLIWISGWLWALDYGSWGCDTGVLTLQNFAEKVSVGCCSTGS
jgi:hypothetical protein